MKVIILTYSNVNYETNRQRKAELSRHASKRAQQRGISPSSMPLVLAFGKQEFDGKGGIRYLMTSESIASLKRTVGLTQQIEALQGVYAVVSTEDSTIITVGHRHC
jgi:hypothetical protein